MTEILSIRKELISEKVFRCMEIMDIDSYPVNPRTIAKNIKEKSKGEIPVILETYSTYSGFCKKTVAEIIKSPFNSSEGATAYLPGMGINAIFYNDTVKVSGRINWTIAHELGHVMLGHYEYMSPQILGEDILENNEYDILEKEADLFAKNLLCSPLILSMCGLFEPASISKMCRISKEAAVNVSKELNLTKKSKLNKWDEALLTRFYDFIHKKKCGTCHKIFAGKDALCCPVCGGTKIEWYNGAQGRYQKGFDPFSYLHCPRCKSTSENSTECTHCGTLLHNYCTSADCGIPLTDDARYCYRCQSPSRYFSEGSLAPWKF